MKKVALVLASLSLLPLEAAAELKYKYEYCGGYGWSADGTRATYVVSGVYRIDRAVTESDLGARNAFTKYLNVHYARGSSVTCFQLTDYQSAENSKNDSIIKAKRQFNVHGVGWAYHGN